MNIHIVWCCTTITFFTTIKFILIILTNFINYNIQSNITYKLTTSYIFIIIYHFNIINSKKLRTTVLKDNGINDLFYVDFGIDSDIPTRALRKTVFAEIFIFASFGYGRFSKIRVGASYSSFFQTRPDSRKLVPTLIFAKKSRKTSRNEPFFEN